MNSIKFVTFIFLGTAVAQLVEALRYKPAGRHWNFSLA
jgi:hypothetical protein